MTPSKFVSEMYEYVRGFRHSERDQEQRLKLFPREELASMLAGRKVRKEWYGTVSSSYNLQPLFTHQQVVQLTHAISLIPRPKTKIPDPEFGLKDEAKKAHEKAVKDAEAAVKKEEAYWPNFFKTPQGFGYHLPTDYYESGAIERILHGDINTIEYVTAIWSLWNHGCKNRAEKDVLKERVENVAGPMVGLGILGLAGYGLKKILTRG